MIDVNPALPVSLYVWISTVSYDKFTGQVDEARCYCCGVTIKGGVHNIEGHLTTKKHISRCGNKTLAETLQQFKDSQSETVCRFCQRRLSTKYARLRHEKDLEFPKLEFKAREEAIYKLAAAGMHFHPDLHGHELISVTCAYLTILTEDVIPNNYPQLLLFN